MAKNVANTTIAIELTEAQFNEFFLEHIKIDRTKVRDFINSLELNEVEKNALFQLTPHNYIGLANKLY